MLSVTNRAFDKENSLYAPSGKTFGSAPSQTKAPQRKALGEITNTPARKALGEITNKQSTSQVPQKSAQKVCLSYYITPQYVLIDVFI
jgi:hypothetical protein